VQPVGDSITEIDGQPRHLHRAGAGRRNHAPRRRRGLRLFRRIRPVGRTRRGTQSRASGPVSYMRVFDRSCETVESAGSRRGAQMGVLRCDHPDIEEFIHAKDSGDLTNFNMSVGVTDTFMQAVEADGAIELVHKAEPAKADIKAAGAYQREDGMWVYRKPRARPVGPDHALDLRPRRAGHPVPRPHQPRQQPVLLRNHRGDQSVRRTAAAALRLLLIWARST
jgi:ribonucleoside-diphosphate reductase alpha chain